MTARERRGSRRERYSARNRRGRSRTTAKLSRRELRQRRQQVAREQSASLKALERRLRRPLTKRERTAELRRIAARHRRDTLAARRRAEAARRAAIARQRALEQSMRDEVQALISRDDITGEDMEVRRAAVNALGKHIGTVVVMDPQTGRVYSMVNQEWALRRGFGEHLRGFRTLQDRPYRRSGLFQQYLFPAHWWQGRIQQDDVLRPGNGFG